MTTYRVIYEDPARPEEPACVLAPSQEWLDKAMEGGHIMPISVWWSLMEDEQKAIDEGRHKEFKHDPEKYAAQWTAPRLGPLTEEEAMEYLVMKDIPRRVWAVEHNRPMFKIVRTEDVPSDRQFRNAWRLTA